MKKLSDIWELLPDLEHTNKTVDSNGLRVYEICNRKFQETAKLDYVLDILKTIEEKYGERARLAKEQNFCDWKAISHAFRAAYQTKQLFSEGDIIFPLKEAEFLKQVKYGELSYKDVGPMLEELIDEVKAIKETCSLPEAPDREFWNDWLYNTMLYKLRNDKVIL